MAPAPVMYSCSAKGACPQHTVEKPCFGNTARHVSERFKWTCRPDASSLKPKAGAAPKKGMQLGKARKANDFLESLRAEGEVIQVSR